MNDEFFSEAKSIIEGMLPNEIKEEAKKHGIDLVSNHSGKKLSEVPYDDIYIGMEVISAIDTPGKVVDKYAAKRGDDDNWLAVDWDSGRSSHDEHYNFSKVTVK